MRGADIRRFRRRSMSWFALNTIVFLFGVIFSTFIIALKIIVRRGRRCSDMLLSGTFLLSFLQEWVSRGDQERFAGWSNQPGWDEYDVVFLRICEWYFRYQVQPVCCISRFSRQVLDLEWVIHRVDFERCVFHLELARRERTRGFHSLIGIAHKPKCELNQPHVPHRIIMILISPSEW